MCCIADEYISILQKLSSSSSSSSSSYPITKLGQSILLRSHYSRRLAVCSVVVQVVVFLLDDIVISSQVLFTMEVYYTESLIHDC
jgi:hypothetical protein